MVDHYRTLVTDLGNNLHEADIPAARTELEKLLGEIEVQTSETEIRLMARDGAVETALLREAGRNQVLMVAGARNVSYMQLPLDPFPLVA